MLNIRRSLFLLQTCLALLAVLVAVVAEIWFKLEPCPLCIVQRIVLLGVAALSFLVFLFYKKPKLASILLGLVAILLGFGMVVAIRHIYLQSLPADVMVSCGPGWYYLLDNFSMPDVFRLIFKGSGECRKVGFVFAGLTMPGWTLCFYGVLSALSFKGFLSRAD